MDEQDLTPDLLLRAYTMGVFPMAESQEDQDIFWVDPRRRGVIPLDAFHISRSLARSLKRNWFSITVNQDFHGTVRACADRPETWINDKIFELYCDLRELGHAHSLEVHSEGILVGGVYGVTIGGAFFGESMFSKRTNASKIALAYLVDRLRQGGFTLFDTQFVTPHLTRLGAQEISRRDYHERLDSALARKASFLTPTTPVTPHDLLQRSTQTS